YTSAKIAALLADADLGSQAIGPHIARWPDAVPSTYESWLQPLPASSPDLRARREVLVAWLNFVSGREPALQSVELRSVKDWQEVVTNVEPPATVSTALNIVREAERRLVGAPSDDLLRKVEAVLSLLH